MVLAACRELEEHAGLASAMVFAGDFNCGAHSGAGELLCTGFVPEDHPDWQRGHGFAWKAFNGPDKSVNTAGEGDWCACLPLSQPVPFANGSASALSFSFLS